MNLQDYLRQQAEVAERHAAKYPNGNPQVFKAGATYIVQNLYQRLSSGREVHSLLDLGCGIGDSTRVIQACVRNEVLAVGIDISLQVLHRYRNHDPRYWSAIATNLDGGSLPFPDSLFNCVLAWRVIEHLHRQVEFLQEIIRVLVPGGFFIVGAPNSTRIFQIPTRIFIWLTSADIDIYPQNPEHVHEPTIYELKTTLESLRGVEEGGVWSIGLGREGFVGNKYARLALHGPLSEPWDRLGHNLVMWEIKAQG